MALLQVRFLTFLYPASSSLASYSESDVLTTLAEGILACPHVPSWENGTATYQIYANTPAFNQTDCITVDGLLPHYTPAGVYGAWQYT